MRKVTYGGANSADNFITGPDEAIDWLQKLQAQECRGQSEHEARGCRADHQGELAGRQQGA